MPAINKTSPVSLKEPVNGTREAKNVEQTQLNKHDAHPNKSIQSEVSSESHNSDPEDHRKDAEELLKSKFANEYNTNSRKKRAPKGRIFQCTGYPDCSMSFTRSEHLARHKRKHTGEKPFTCPHCHKNFSRLDNLRQHKQTVHSYENFMGSNSNNMPIQTNYDASGTGGSIVDSNSTNYMPIPNHLSKNNCANKGALESPLNYGFGNSPGSTPMISPPNTNSPVNYNLPYQNQPYHNNSFDLSNNGVNNSFQYPESQIKTKINEFKPKRRPRPLSLVHSFTDNPATGDNNSLHIGQLLKSAPVMYNTNGALAYPPKSTPLTPNMVSPLSPLFRHTFNQTMDLPKSPHISSNNLRLPPYNHPINNNNIPNNLANKNITLPPVQELPIPTQFNLIKTSKSWLKEVLNDDSAASSNSTNDTNLLSVTQEDKHVSKKPTINNLLSPYDDDEYPNSVK